MPSNFFEEVQKIPGVPTLIRTRRKNCPSLNDYFLTSQPDELKEILLELVRTNAKATGAKIDIKDLAEKVHKIFLEKASSDFEITKKIWYF
jgi:hypothetical protein